VDGPILELRYVPPESLDFVVFFTQVHPPFASIFPLIFHSCFPCLFRTPPLIKICPSLSPQLFHIVFCCCGPVSLGSFVDVTRAPRTLFKHSCRERVARLPDAQAHPHLAVLDHMIDAFTPSDADFTAALSSKVRYRPAVSQIYSQRGRPSQLFPDFYLGG